MAVSMSPPARSAGRVEANRRTAPVSERYSGLMPSRSRPKSTRPESRSTMQNANIPFRRSTTPSPQQGPPATSRIALDDAEREHPLEAFHEALTPAVVALQEYLRVGGGEEAVSFLLLEIATELGVVVDAAVECYGQSELGVHHRLGAAVGEVDDLQASEGERDGPTGPHPAAVRPAVCHGGAHPGDRLYVGQVSNS